MTLPSSSRSSSLSQSCRIIAQDNYWNTSGRIMLRSPFIPKSRLCTWSPTSSFPGSSLISHQLEKMLLWLRNSVEGHCLAHLVCRPCEQRINNFKVFKGTICTSQAVYEQRFKRWIEVSTSVPQTLTESQAGDWCNNSVKSSWTFFLCTGIIKRTKVMCSIRVCLYLFLISGRDTFTCVL